MAQGDYEIGDKCFNYISEPGDLYGSIYEFESKLDYHKW